MLKDEDNVVGYIYGAYISLKLYNLLINGDIISDCLIDEKEYIDDSNYMYIASIVIKKEYCNNNYSFLLHKDFLKDNKDKKIVLLTVHHKK